MGHFVSFLSSLYILDINSLSDVSLTKIPSHSVGFPSLNQLVFSFMKSHFLIHEIPLLSCWPWFLGNQSPIHLHLCHVGSDHVFFQQLQGFRFHIQVFDLELVFVQGDRYGCNFVLLPVEFSFSNTIYEDATFFLLNAFFSSLLNIRRLWLQALMFGLFYFIGPHVCCASIVIITMAL